MTPIKHLSYSQYNTYTQCPRSWYLSKVVQAEGKQTWYLPIGSAVHDMIEARLSRTDVTPIAEDYFYPLIRKQMEIEPDTRLWLAGGSREAPVVEKLALQQVKDCFEKAVEYLEDIDVWEVEYDASGSLPGLTPPLKAFVDIVGEHKKKGPVIVDWKTGSTKPGNFQLETYAALLKTSEYGRRVKVDAWKGRYLMLKPGTVETRYVDLSKVDPAAVGAKYEKVYQQMLKRVYAAKTGFGCGFCFHQENCIDNAGPTPRAVHYDKAEEDGFIF